MNIKPTEQQEQQVREWAEGAGEYADMKRKTWEAWDLLRDQKLAELAAKWGASQAQQTTADAGRVLEWMRTPNRKPANLAFTDGPERQAAYWIEIAQQRVAQQTTEPELPEAAKCEGGWGELCVYYYTAAQMHEHYAAGVRAGAAGSQDANEEVVTITVPLSHINSLQVESIKRLVARTKHAHMTDVRIRINGNYEYFEADWLKYVVIGGGA